MITENLCLHCLETGEWEDEDACPSCRAKDHVSPWRVSGCVACNDNYFKGLAVLSRDIDIRVDVNDAIADLQARVRKLEEINASRIP